MTVTITTTSPTITISTTTATTSYSGSEIRTLGGMLGRGRLAITSTYTVVDADRGKTVDATSGTFSLNLTSAATLGSGWHFTAANSGSGTVTIDPASTETIRGPAGSATTLALTQGQAVTLVSDGTNWLVVSSVGLAPVSSATIITSTIQAATSAGITVQNSTPATVMTIGPGPGTGVAFAGGITSAAITATSASGITTLQASTQDAIALLGRAGGTSSYVGTITPTTLTASRTYTMPDATTTIAGLALSQTFTGIQTISNVTNSTTTTNGALIVSGGVGIGLNTNIGGILNVTHATNGDNAAYLRNTHASGFGPVFRGGGASSSVYLALFQDNAGSQKMMLNGSGALILGSDPGGTDLLRIGGRTTINDITSLTATTASTSSTTGALVVSGGAGIGGDMTFAYNGANGGYRVVQFTDNVSSVNFVIGRSSNTYTTGGAVGWLGNNQAFVYSATTFRLGVTTGTNTYFEIANTSCSFGSSYQVNVLATTASTSTATGALVVSGGAGFAKQVSALNYLATMGTITSAEPVFDSTVTWNSGGTTFDGIKLNVTDTASASASTLINLQVASSSKFSISKGGNITAAGDTVNLNGRALFYSDASNGILYGGSTGFIVASTSGAQSWLTTTASATTVQSFTANTNSAATAFRIDHETSGTPANGLGTGFVVRCETSTTANQNMFQVESTWVDVTHASRKARTIFYEYDTTSRECLRMEASGSAAMLGFFGASAVARPSSTGETVGFTAGAGTNVTDQSTFTGNVGATAYRLSDIVKHLKNLGLIAS